jgi:3-oxoacyl-[acyl-carrier-protein] synthase III
MWRRPALSPARTWPPAKVELIVYGSCSNDEVVPNSASGLQIKLGSESAAAMDINTACTSFLYALSTATVMIRTGVVRYAVVVGVELISPFMDWSNRGVAVLFGDGAAAVVLQATERKEGLLAEKRGCYADARQILRVRGMGTTYANHGVTSRPHSPAASPGVRISCDGASVRRRFPRRTSTSRGAGGQLSSESAS